MAGMVIDHGFKVGDVVICVEPNHRLRLDQEYIISHETGKGDAPGWVRIQGVDAGFFPNRFKLKEQEMPVAKKVVEKKEAVGAKAGDVVIPRKFDGNLVDGKLHFPGYVPLMDKVCGDPIVAVELHKPFAGFVPMLMVGQYYWPISHLDVVKDGKVIKAAKKKFGKPAKAKKPVKMTLRQKLNKEARVSTCSYGHQYEDGTFNMQNADACHARLRGGEPGKPMKAIALNMAIYVKEMPEESKKIFNKYYNYLANRSPGAEAFKTKKASEALSRGILMNVESTMGKIGWGAVALRQASEWSGVLPAFEWALKQKGISEHAAFLFANIHHKHAGGWTIKMDGGHQCLHRNLDFFKMCEAFKHGFYVPKDAVPAREGGLYKVSPNWYEGATTWGDEKTPPDRKLENVFDKFPPVQEGEGWNKKLTYTEAVLLKRLNFINDTINAVK